MTWGVGSSIDFLRAAPEWNSVLTRPIGGSLRVLGLSSQEQSTKGLGNVLHAEQILHLDSGPMAPCGWGEVQGFCSR